jgi:hypothetical protein
MSEWLLNLALDRDHYWDFLRREWMCDSGCSQCCCWRVLQSYRISHHWLTSVNDVSEESNACLLSVVERENKFLEEFGVLCRESEQQTATESEQKRVSNRQQQRASNRQQQRASNRQQQRASSRQQQRASSRQQQRASNRQQQRASQETATESKPRDSNKCPRKLSFLVTYEIEALSSLERS